MGFRLASLGAGGEEIKKKRNENTLERKRGEAVLGRRRSFHFLFKKEK